MRTSEEHERVVSGYIADVQSGRRIVGRLERLGVDRHVRDLAQGEARGLRFNDVRALDAIWWIENFLVLPKGEWYGKPFLLQPWQMFIVWNLFGWERLVDGRWLRRFRTGYLSVARKNGKSPFAVAIGLLMLVTSGAASAAYGVQEYGAEVYVAATKRDQAAVCYRYAATMVRKSKKLSEAIDVNESRNNLILRSTESRFEALAAEANTLDSLSPYCAIVDELHEHPDSSVWDVLESGTGSRRESLMLGTTTAGSEREGICWRLEQDAISALEGVGEESGNSDDLYGFIARIDEGDDPFDEANWPKSNPNLGVSVHLENLRVAAKTAARRPGALNEFLRKRLNLWTEADTAWFPVPRWDACGVDPLPETLPAEPCFVGIDLSSTCDTTALVAVWPREDGTYLVWPWIFVPAETIQDRVPRERKLFEQWAREGLIIATPGDQTDYEAVAAKLIELHQACGIREAVFDRWGASPLTATCEREGIQAVLFGQGMKDMSPAMKFSEVLIKNGRLRHGGHPVLRWMFMNVSVKRDPAENMKPDKSRASGRIDGIVAMIMALGRAGTQVVESGPAIEVWG